MFKFFHGYTDTISGSDLTNPRSYDTMEYDFIGVTQIFIDPETLELCKFMMYRHIITQEVIRDTKITVEHPMWNYH